MITPTSPRKTIDTPSPAGRGRPPSDIALLQVDASGLTLHPLALGSVESLRVGDPLFLVGDPFGYARSLSTGVGFAVPIDLARSGLPQLERGVTPAHAFLGVGADATGSGGRNGALVQSVRAGSPAAAGLKVDDVTLTQQPATAASG